VKSKGGWAKSKEVPKKKSEKNIGGGGLASRYSDFRCLLFSPGPGVRDLRGKRAGLSGDGTEQSGGKYFYEQMTP